MEEKKLAEGEKCMVAGAKSEKTGLFSRWKPDWDSAAAEYERAAACFRVAKAMPRAIDAFVRASQAHANLDSGFFMAAKHLESAAFIARDLKEAPKAADLYERASQLHQQDGRPDAAAEALMKGARVLEAVDAGSGADLAVRACGILEGEEDERVLRVCVETFKQAVALLLRQQQWDKAAGLLHKQSSIHGVLGQPHGVARCQLSALGARRAADQFAAAEADNDKALAAANGWAGSDEAALAETLLGAFSAQDEDGVAKAVGDQLFNHLENQVTHVARSLTLRSAGVPADRLNANLPVGSSAPLPPIAAGAGTGDFGEVAPEDELTDDLT